MVENCQRLEFHKHHHMLGFPVLSLMTLARKLSPLQEQRLGHVLLQQQVCIWGFLRPLVVCLEEISNG